MRVWYWVAGLMMMAGTVQAEQGCLKAGGKPITPAEEGPLVRLAKPGGRCTGTAYTLVRSGGDPVIVWTAEGHVLTPREAWEQYAGQAPLPPAPPRHPGEGTFSMPGTTRR